MKSCAAKTLTDRTRSDHPTAFVHGIKKYDIIQTQLLFFDVDANHKYDQSSQGNIEKDHCTVASKVIEN